MKFVNSIYKKVFLLICGTIALILGVIGVVIPGLPTTPFLLLASFCYLRSSKKMYDWLMGHRVFGMYLYNYIHYKAIDKRTKIGAVIFLWCSMGISIYFLNSIHLRIFLVVVGIGVTLHLLMLKTMKIENYGKEKL